MLPPGRVPRSLARSNSRVDTHWPFVISGERLGLLAGLTVGQLARTWKTLQCKVGQNKVISRSQAELAY